jgi:uncharacterized protein YceH (UPF0502 family)
MRAPLPRPLDPHELRVLGCLLEKEQATPEYYPLTVNAIVAACNQRSNRDPVLALQESEVQGALRRLLTEGLVQLRETSRATKWQHRLDSALGLTARTKAALTVLMLRGPQTSGEVRSRSSRLHAFDSSSAAEAALADLAAPPDPVAMLLEREPGQKEPRWNHCLGAEDVSAPAAPAAAAPPEPRRDTDVAQLELRIRRLEQQVQEIETLLEQRRPLVD